MPRVSKKALEQEFTRLCWRLIELKVAYYRPEAVHPSRLDDVIIPDDDYDALELRYLTLARTLGRPNTLVHKGYPGFEDMLDGEWGSYPGGKKIGPMMEIDETRPSVELALAKLRTMK